MEKTSLDAYRKVQPDKRLVIVPPLSWEDREMLSRQTGFNRTILESSGECGCFYCGRRFPTNLISNWLVEPGEEDTGCCPYCGKDTLIVGTEEFLLSTALLTSLYMDRFASEYERNKHCAFEIPLFKNHLDYLSKGVPFRWKISAPQRPSVEIPAWSADGQRYPRERGLHALAEIPIWSVGDLGDWNFDCEGAEEPGIYTDIPLGGKWRLRVWEEKADGEPSEEEAGHTDDETSWNGIDSVEHYELVRDGVTVRFSPWSGGDQCLLQSLYEKHGDSLMALFKDPDFSCLEVFVEGDA